MQPFLWQDCFRAMNAIAGRPCLSWPQEGPGGFNCHEDFTVPDVSDGAAWLLTAPGDALLGPPWVASLLELQTPVVGHVFSWWLGVMLLIPVALVIVAPFVYATEGRERRRQRGL